MQINIPQILEDLSLIKKLLESFLQDGTLTISEERLIVDFFIHYQSTNELVSNAIKQIRSKAEGALDMFAGLQHAMESFLVFYSNNEKDFNTIDFKRDCNKYLEQFDNAYKSASTEATSNWKRIQELSNKLDFMWETDEEYPPLRKECDEKESLYYNTLKPQVDRLFAEYKKQEEYIAPIYYFEMDMLIVLIAKMRDIAASAIEDIHAMRKRDWRMRTKKVLLSEAEVLSVARYFDFLEHSLCCMLYKVCNDRLIEPTTMSNVIGWLNLKDANPPICIKSKQKTRCCYLFKEISNFIINKQYKDEWILLMLKSVGISEKHYNAHTYEVGATKLEEDLNLIADIKLAIKRAALYSENYAKLSQYLNSEDKEES